MAERGLELTFACLLLRELPGALPKGLAEGGESVGVLVEEVDVVATHHLLEVALQARGDLHQRVGRVRLLVLSPHLSGREEEERVSE